MTILASKISPQSFQTVEYRRGNELLFAAKPGKVSILISSGLRSISQLEEYIEALREAAKAAHLPDLTPTQEF